jgi:hypothetical protein
MTIYRSSSADFFIILRFLSSRVGKRRQGGQLVADEDEEIVLSGSLKKGGGYDAVSCCGPTKAEGKDATFTINTSRQEYAYRHEYQRLTWTFKPSSGCGRQQMILKESRLVRRTKPFLPWTGHPLWMIRLSRDPQIATTNCLGVGCNPTGGTADTDQYYCCTLATAVTRKSLPKRFLFFCGLQQRRL